MNNGIKGFIAGVCVLALLGTGGYFGWKYQDKIKAAFSGEQQVRPVKPDKPQGKVLPYEFNGSELVKYTGDSEGIIEIPSSYSLGEIKEEDKKGIKTIRELEECVGQLNCAFNITDAISRKFEFENMEAFFEFRNSYDEDNSIIYFPLSLKYSSQIYIEGTDFEIVSIGERAFLNSNFTQIQLPNGIVNIGDSAFAWSQNLTKVYIPDSVKMLGNGCFSNTKLREIVLPFSLESIEGSLFFGCSELTRVVIPAGVKYIRGFAFTGCSALQELVLPGSIVSLENSIFQNCDNLNRIILNSDTFVTISNLTFDMTSDNLKIYVKDELYNEYLNDLEWSQYANRLIRLSEMEG